MRHIFYFYWLRWRTDLYQTNMVSCIWRRFLGCHIAFLAALILQLALFQLFFPLICAVTAFSHIKNKQVVTKEQPMFWPWINNINPFLIIFTLCLRGVKENPTSSTYLRCLWLHTFMLEPTLPLLKLFSQVRLVQQNKINTIVAHFPTQQYSSIFSDVWH